TRSRSRNTGLEVDLNDPPSGNHSQEGNSSRGRSQDKRSAPAPIDLETNDDDVVISSPRAFAEARKTVRGNRKRPIVVDVENDEKSSPAKRGRVPTTPAFIDCIILDVSYSFFFSQTHWKKLSMGTVVLQAKVRKNGEAPPPPPPPPIEQTLNCPICLGPIVEAMTTKCGHVFCKACIKAAIAKQSKCPNCRKRTTARDIIRIYLP
ncbi:hypothetical protein M569_00363, partial [Genlisea aurea]